jgi:hypothetical protein
MNDRPSINRLTGQVIEYGRHGNSSAHDNLVLPTGKKIADSSLDEIRSVMAALGDDRAFVDGRALLCSRYHERVSEIFHTAGAAAVKNYLKDLEQQNKC